MYFYKENKMGAKIFKKKYVGPILMFAHLNYQIFIYHSVTKIERKIDRIR